MQLNLPNVSMYLDAGHAGWLGWAANIGPAATMFGKVYSDAGKPAAVRGLATNVANYNAFSIATCPSYTSGDANCDEKRYINALSPLLTSAGFPAHFITDTSRNGVQPTQQQAWGDWCNVIGTGFGVRPTTNTGDALADAFVWVKPGGECDVRRQLSYYGSIADISHLGNIRYLFCSIRFPLRSFRCSPARSRGWKLVPSLLHSTVDQRQPNILSTKLMLSSKSNLHCTRLLPVEHD
jgi:cellulase/cellobiase CelA1